MAKTASLFDTPVTTADDATETRYDRPDAIEGQSSGAADVEAWRRAFRIERDAVAMQRYESVLPELRATAAKLQQEVDTVKAELARLRKYAAQTSDAGGWVSIGQTLKRKHELVRYEENVYYPTLKKWCQVDSDIRGIEADMERRVSWLAADGVTWKRGTVTDLQAPAREAA